MVGATSAAGASDLDRAAGRFAIWRKGRVVGARIPTPLWNLAVNLAERHGVSRTAQALRVGYYSLQERVRARARTAASSVTSVTVEKKAKLPTFVELPAAPFGAVCECSIEFEKPCGTTLRIQVRGPQLPDLSALGREFWDAR